MPQEVVITADAMCVLGVFRLALLKELDQKLSDIQQSAVEMACDNAPTGAPLVTVGVDEVQKSYLSHKQ
jgi:hypothetical protein